MKTLTTLFLLIPCILTAQENCDGANLKHFIFQANAIGAAFMPQGEKFFTYSNGYFKVPYTSEDAPNSIFASSLWIGGLVNGELRMSGQTYVGPNLQEYYPGPLGTQGEIIPGICENFKRVWEISRTDIVRHIEDYTADNTINDTLSSVFGWPAQGNQFFEEVNGFALPADHNGGWAAFEDINANNLYEPDLGEYPLINLKENKYVPEHIMWMVFHDVGDHDETGGIPLGIEIQLTVFGFNCTEQNTLNNTLFNSSKIINQSDDQIDSTYFGIWTDYDLGCAEDDFMGSDSSRNSEFVYNQDPIDGDGFGCESGSSGYHFFSPVQSHTYISHPMNSFIIAEHPEHGFFPSYLDEPVKYYRLLKGTWADGFPITAYGNGYNTVGNYPQTKFLHNGDPLISNSWSQNNNPDPVTKSRVISSVFLDMLSAKQHVVVETAYQFHLDTSLNNIEQVGFMQNNIDYLIDNINNVTTGCSSYPVCNDDDCVWPGDFDHNGIADHFDILYWGVMKDSSGAPRDGLINWRGHFADNWSFTLPFNVNAKHGDGNGDGLINRNDIDRNEHHFSLTTPDYQRHDEFPEGPELVISASPLVATSGIRSVTINAGIELENVLGLAYEIDFDTSLFTLSPTINIIDCPSDENAICFGKYGFSPNSSFETTIPKYAFVKDDHQTVTVEEDFQFQRLFNVLRLKDGLEPDDVPDSTILRLRNLVAIDAGGNDLQFGANTLVVYKEGITSVLETESNTINIYPNPSDEYVFFDVPKDIEGELINLQGQVIDKFIISPTQSLDVSIYQPGIYFIRVHGFHYQAKIIIQ